MNASEFGTTDKLPVFRAGVFASLLANVKSEIK